MGNSKYQIGSSALDVLANAVKIGAEFEGWYTSSDFSSASKVDANTKLYNDVTLYAKFKTISSSSSKITFDYNGGVSEAIYDKFGNKLSTLTVSNYNGDFWSAHKTNIYISTGENDPKAKFGTRIYVGKDEYIGMYKVVAIQTS
ncbi:MAG: InlB B-repeat-containing protein, partial [Lachnospiraceae bacterium]|nr:InlB B-repeat-containing protein [Lachnospiraceae bacterium]